MSREGQIRMSLDSNCAPGIGLGVQWMSKVPFCNSDLSALRRGFEAAPIAGGRIGHRKLQRRSPNASRPV
jgi:hypothetical protein